MIRYEPYQVLERSNSTNAYGEEIESYAPDSWLQLHVQPVSAKNAEYGGLLGFKVTLEAYTVAPVTLSTRDNRIRLGGTDYHIREIRAWPTHSELLLEEVIV